MASFAICGVEVSGLACAVPENRVDLEGLSAQVGTKKAEQISKSVGIDSRPIAPPGLCASDLCFCAAEKLLDEMEWSRDSIEALIFVTQTPDHKVPATACILQNRLGLSASCISFDVNLGCSGYVYGLSIVSQFIACGSIKRALVLVGDTISHLVSEQDASTVALFGDAGTATALQRNSKASPMSFSLGTDGSGAEHLIVPAGMHRSPSTPDTIVRKEDSAGNLRSEEELYMDGAQVFSFTLSKIPILVKQTLAAADWTMEDLDGVVMHQANHFMLSHLAKKLKIPAEKFVIAMKEYGNTSCASIPLAICSSLSPGISSQQLNLLLVGFGVGWSWGAVTLTCGPIYVPEIICVPSINSPVDQRVSLSESI